MSSLGVGTSSERNLGALIWTVWWFWLISIILKIRIRNAARRYGNANPTNVVVINTNNNNGGVATAYANMGYNNEEAMAYGNNNQQGQVSQPIYVQPQQPQQVPYQQTQPVYVQPQQPQQVPQNQAVYGQQTM